MIAYDRALENLQRTHKRFIETGVVYLVNDWTDRKQTIAESAFGLSKLFRQTARDLGRPFILVKEQRAKSWDRDPNTGEYKRGEAKVSFTISIPKTKKVVELVGPLILAAESGAIHKKSYHKSWLFRIPPGANELVDSFMDQATKRVTTLPSK